jgi:hypothetical protein
MHKELSTIQQISQARLKGTPRIMGSRRSQSATEKHIATKGIKPRRRATGDGFFTDTDSLSIARLLKRIRRGFTNLGSKRIAWGKRFSG